MSKTEIEKNTFMWYYQNDPKFRAKHLKYLAEKVKCSCGSKVRRNNLTRHKRTEKHKTMIKNQNNDISEMKKEIKLLKKLVKDLK